MPQTPDDFQRTVRYYCLHLAPKKGNPDGKPAYIAPRQWMEALERFGQGTQDDRTIDNVIFDLHEAGNHTDHALVGMHKALDPKHITEIHQDHVDDFSLETESGLRRLAFASAAVFTTIGQRLVVAVSMSKGIYSPTHVNAEKLINRSLPAPSGMEWKIQGISALPQTEELHQAPGITSLTGGFYGVPNPLLGYGTLNDDSGNPYVQDLVDRAASYAGSEVEVQLTVRLRNPKGASPEEARRFKQFATTSLDHFRGQVHPRATTYDRAGEGQLLELALHGFASAITLNVNDVVARYFSGLLRSVSDELHEQERRLAELLRLPENREGSPHRED